jgi:multiple sugar transport system permease protein
MEKTGKRSLSDIAAHAVVIVLLVWTIFPLYWLVVTAFKPLNEFMTYPPTFWPTTWTLDNFYEGLIRQKGLAALADSLKISVGAFIVSLLVGVPAAYSISRYRTGGDNLSFTILSFRFMPPIVPAVALFLIASKLGILDKTYTLVIVNCMAVVPFVVWIMKGFFDEIPPSIEEAAEVDGASWPRLFWDHVLPLAAPGLVAVSLFAFIFTWNELLFATILTGRNVTPFTKIVPGINIGHVEPHWGAIAALGLIVIIPIVFGSWYLQKYIVRGMSYGAIRE